jgi:uncharacterized protein
VIGQPRIMLRPLATPLPLGFLALFVATFAFSTVQLGWVAEGQGAIIALGVLIFTVPLQLVASVMGFLARDPVAATGMGILAGTWAAAALTTFRTPPGASTEGLGVILVAAACALLVPAVAGRAKGIAAAVMALSALRFAVTGVAEWSAVPVWLTAAGWVGIALAAVSLYAASAFELEGTQQKAVLPLGRTGKAERAMQGTRSLDPAELAREPGVRDQL